jgi:hypothetical protein
LILLKGRVALAPVPTTPPEGHVTFGARISPQSLPF